MNIMNNPFLGILASTTPGVKRTSPQQKPSSHQQQAAEKRQPAHAAATTTNKNIIKRAVAPVAAKSSGGAGTKGTGSGSAGTAAKQKRISELKAALAKVETLTGGKLSSKELFSSFVSASRAAAQASGNLCPGHAAAGQENSGNALCSEPLPAPVKSTLTMNVNSVLESEPEPEGEDLFDYGGFVFSPEAPSEHAKALSRLIRYSLGVTRFSLPGRLSMGPRRMSMGTLSPMLPHRPLVGLRSASNESTTPPPEHLNFVEFYCVGVDRAILSGFEVPRRSTLQPVQLLDVFPAASDCQMPAIETIADYCFPAGAKLQLVTGHAAIKRLGQSPPRDAFHVLQFCDAEGTPTYGACLTVTELIEAPNDMLLENLIELHGLERAASIIKRFLRRIASGSISKAATLSKHQSRPFSTPLKPSVSSMSTTASVTAAGSALVNRMVAWSARKTPRDNASRPLQTPSMTGLLHRFGKSKLEQPEVSSIIAGTAGTTSSSSQEAFKSSTANLPTPERLMYNPLGLAEFFSDENSFDDDNDDDDDDDDDDEDDNHSNGNDKHDDMSSGKLNKKMEKTADMKNMGASGLDIRETIVEKKLESRRSSASTATDPNVNLSSSPPRMVLTQRAYCIVSTQPLHTLFFKILEAVAHRERASSRDVQKQGLGSTLAQISAPVPSTSLLRASALLSLQVREFSRQRTTSTSSAASSASAARCRSESAVSTASSASTSSSSSSLSLLGNLSSGAGGILVDAIYFSRKARRDRFLAHMQHLALSLDADEGVISVSCPAYIKALRIEARATSHTEWTCAALFCTLPAPVVVQILSLLLLEKSLIVCGSDLGLVSAIGTAFTLLLKPFSWQGVFVPILPLTALEVLEAPVPFIVGVTTPLPTMHDISSAAAVLFLDDYLDQGLASAATADTSGRSIRASRRLHRRRFLLVPTDDAVAGLADPTKSSDLAPLAKDLEVLVAQLRLGKRAISLRTASVQLVTFMLGLTPQEKRIVGSLLSAVEAYNKRLLGKDLLEPGGWRKYGLFNEASNSWEFFPELFIEPLRARLAFQEGVVHTQLFVSFLDEMKRKEQIQAQGDM